MLEGGAWLKNAAHANACARRLAIAVADLPDFKLMFPVQANAAFLAASEAKLEALRQRGWRFYTFIGGGAALHVRMGCRSRAGRRTGPRHPRGQRRAG